MLIVALLQQSASQALEREALVPQLRFAVATAYPPQGKAASMHPAIQGEKLCIFQCRVQAVAMCR